MRKIIESGIISNSELKKLKSTYKKGDRVKLLKMDDRQAPPVGTRGTVELVDDIGTIHVRWDTGSGLGVAYGEDKCVKISEAGIRDLKGEFNVVSPNLEEYTAFGVKLQGGRVTDKQAIKLIRNIKKFFVGDFSKIIEEEIKNQNVTTYPNRYMSSYSSMNTERAKPSEIGKDCQRFLKAYSEGRLTNEYSMRSFTPIAYVDFVFELPNKMVFGLTDIEKIFLREVKKSKYVTMNNERSYVDDIHIYFREQTTESQIESGYRRNFVTGVNVKYYPESYIKEL